MQRSTGCGPWAESGPAPAVFGTQAHGCVHMSSVAAVVPPQQSFAVAAEAVWLTEPKIFSVWPLLKKFVDF